MKIKDILEFAPMARPIQKQVHNQPKDGDRLPDGSYVKDTSHYDPAVVARIKEGAANPLGLRHTPQQAMAFIDALVKKSNGE